MGDSKKYLLIADPDDDILKTAPLAPPPDMPIPLHGKTLRDCQRRLSSRSTNFVGFFFNPSLGHPGWVSILRAAVANFPNCPSFLICEDDPPLSPEELAKINITKVLRKPVHFDQILAEVGIAHVSPKTALSADSEPPPVKSEAGDELYIPVRTMTLLIQRPLQFDIFVRLSAGHYTKVWNSKDVVDIKQLDRQAEKGVPAYYILKEEQEHNLEACDAGIQKLIADPSIPIEMKTEEVLAAGAATIDFLKSQGVSQQSMVHATNYAVTAQKAAAEVARSNGHLRKFLLDTAIQDHAIATSMLGALVLQNMKAPPGDMFNKLNIALMFHDIGIWDQPRVVQDEDESQMTPEQIEIFHSHPTVGAKILRDVGGFPNGLLEAIEAHHMRLGKLGFPTRQGVAKVNAVAELIGICSDFAHVIAKAKPEEQGEAFSTFLAQVREGFSPAIVSAFERAFCSLG